MGVGSHERVDPPRRAHDNGCVTDRAGVTVPAVQSCSEHRMHMDHMGHADAQY